LNKLLQEINLHSSIAGQIAMSNFAASLMPDDLIVDWRVMQLNGQVSICLENSL
jgi:hypothetical protein